MKRINLTMDEGLYKRLEKFVPHGQRSVVHREALNLILNMIEEHGSAALGLIITGHVKLAENTKPLSDQNGASDAPE